MHHHVAVPTSTACLLLRSTPTRLTCSFRSRGISIISPTRGQKKALSVATIRVTSATAHTSPHIRHDAARLCIHQGVPERLAVVTGADRGIALEVCRQLALQGVTVILTAMLDDQQGEEAAASTRHESNLPNNVIFRQLDIRDIDGANSLAEFIQSAYGKLDILVNNAAVPGLVADEEGLRALNIDGNIDSKTENWDEQRIEAMLDAFLEDLKNGRVEQAGWSMMLPAYSISKMAVNVYTRVLAWRHLEMRVNCVHPGFVRTEMNWNMGTLSPAEGARGPVMLALLPDDGPTGCYFDETELAEAW